MNIGDIVAHLKLDMSEFSNGIQQATKEATNMAATTAQTASEVGSALTQTGAVLTATVTAPIVAMGVASVKASSDFQSAMSNVQALSGATGKDLEMLSDTAKHFGATTQFSATEAADALGYMALAGWDANQSAAGLPGVLNLAAASGMGLAQASDLVTDYLSAFGQEASQAGKMADVLAYAQANSNTTTEALGGAFKNCAVNAKGFGMDIEQTTAVLGKLADQGLKGSEAGTALNAVIRDMTSKMEKGKIQVGKTAVAITDANGNFRDMKDIVKDVEKATNGMTEAERVNALQSTFTADSIKAMGILLNTGSDALGEFTDELYKSNGAAEEMAKIMNDNLQGKIKELKSAFEALCINLGEIFIPILEVLVSGLTKVISFFSKLPKPVLLVISVLAGLLAAIGPIILVLGSFMGALSNIITTWQLLSSVLGGGTSIFGILKGLISQVIPIFTTLGKTVLPAVIGAFKSLFAVLLANPITLIIGAIVALVAGFIYCWNNVDGFKEFWIDLWEALKWWCSNAIEAIGEWLGEFGESMKEFFTKTVPEACEKTIDWFKQLPEKIGEFLSKTIEKVKEWATDLANKAIEGGQSFIENTIKFFTELPSRLSDWLSKAIDNVTTWASDMASKALEMGSQFLNNVIQFYTQLPEKIWYWLVFSVSYVVLWTKQMIEKGIEAGSKFLSGVIDYIKELPAKLSEWLTTAKDNVVQWGTEVINKGIETGQKFLNGIVEFFTQLPGRILQFITTAKENIIQWALEVVNKARETGQNFLNGIIEFFTQLPGRVSQFIEDTKQRIIQWARDVVNKARETASNFLNAIIEFFQQLPGKVAKWLTDTIAKVREWATNMIAKAKQAGTDFVNNVINFIKQLPGKIAEWLNQVIGKVRQWASDMAQKAREAGQKVRDNVINPIKELPGRMVQLGRDIISGIINGITGAARNLYNKMRNIASEALNAAKEKLGIHSPSRVFAKEVGKMIPAGISLGIDTNADEAVNSVNSLAKSLAYDVNYTPLSNAINSTNIASNIGRSNNSDVNLLHSLLNELKKVNEHNTEYNINIENMNANNTNDIRKLAEELEAFKRYKTTF